MSSNANLLALCALMLSLPVPAEAQGVGGRLRQRVAEVAGGKDNTEQAQQKSPFNETVIEITGPVLAGFMKGLDTEIALLVDFGKLLATFRTPEEYGACQAQVAMSPEGMKVMEQITNLRDDATAEEYQRAMEKMNRDMLALTTKTCGADPAEWPAARRRETLEEIEKKAAAAAGPVRSSPPSPHGGPSPIEHGADAPAAFPDWMQDTGLSPQAYAIMKERIDAYCNALNAGAIQPGQAVTFPGTGKDIFWVYTEEESKQIAPLCDQLKNKRRITMEIGEIVIQPSSKITLEILDAIILSKQPDLPEAVP